MLYIKISRTYCTLKKIFKNSLDLEKCLLKFSLIEKIVFHKSYNKGVNEISETLIMKPDINVEEKKTPFSGWLSS